MYQLRFVILFFTITFICLETLEFMINVDLILTIKNIMRKALHVVEIDKIEC